MDPGNANFTRNMPIRWIPNGWNPVAKAGNRGSRGPSRARRQSRCSRLTTSGGGGFYLSIVRTYHQYMATASLMNEPPEANSPHELIRAAQGGDHAAFGEIVRTYQSYAYALAMRFVWDHAEAEDIVQESFIRVWRHCPSYTGDTKFTTWLYSIVTRVAMDRIRRRNRWSLLLVRGVGEAEGPVGQSTMEGALHNAQAIERVREVTKRLPHVQRLVFTLRDLQDLPVEDVARITGMSAASIKANLCHARKRIRHLLPAYGISEGR